jgi:hypothetical protein
MIITIMVEGNSGTVGDGEGGDGVSVEKEVVEGSK